MNEWDERALEWPSLALPLRRGEPLPVVVEVGGFEGRWVSQMAELYVARFVVFEPQEWAHERLRARVLPVLRSTASLTIHPYGLGTQATTLPMGGWGTDACSFLLNEHYYAEHPEEGRRDVGTGRLVAVQSAFERNGFDEVDVMMMNCEGFEFVILPEMLRLDYVQRVRNLAVQFHRAHDPDGSMERSLREQIAETHDVHFDFGSTLTAWTRRDA